MKICFKMVTGDTYTLSNTVYVGSEPLGDVVNAQVELSFILTKMAFFVCDQGEYISCKHIVSAHIEP